MVINDFKILERLLRPRSIYNLYHFRPVQGFSIDSRAIQKGQAFVAIKGQYHDGHTFIADAVNKGSTFIIAEKYVPHAPRLPLFVVDDTYDALKKISAFIINKKKPAVAAISGSLGKTTTKDMLSYLLDGHYRVCKNKGTENNLLGVSKTVMSLNNENMLVLELGTNGEGQMQTLAGIIKPHVGIITCIKPVHLEGLKNLQGIVKEKSALLRVNTHIKAVLNRDDQYLRKIDWCKKTYWFGKSKDNDVYARLIQRTPAQSKFLINDKFPLVLPMHYEGFIMNAMAAVLAGYVFGIKIQELVEKLNQFNAFSAKRMQIDYASGVMIINDAYSANPYSVKYALGIVARYALKKIVVLGDMLELGDNSEEYHRNIAQDVINSNCDYCLCLGKYMKHLIDCLNDRGFRRAIHCSSHDEIVNFIKKKAKKGWLVFLKGSRKMELERVHMGLLGSCAAKPQRKLEITKF